MLALGFLDKFERRLERFVNGAFSKAFKSQIQPVEISSAIRAKMDQTAAVVDKDRILAPNGFKVRISQSDFTRLSQLGPALQDEIRSKVKSHAKKQRYQFSGALEIAIEPSPSLTLGQIQVSASGSKTPDVEKVSWVPVLDINGERHKLTLPKTTIGRDNTANLQVDDAGLSRVHFAISWDGTNARIEDLGSTNGTRVGGVKISSQSISSDTAITAGRTDFVFRIIASGDMS